MTLEEQMLRELLHSGYGRLAGGSILYRAAAGEPLTIAMESGDLIRLKGLTHAQQILQEVFEWTTWAEVNPIRCLIYMV